MNIKDLLPKNLPLLNKNPENVEYYFGLNIGSDNLSASVWGIIGNKLQIINAINRKVRGDEDLVEAANSLLDDVLMDFQPEPEKILFGVPDSWMLDDNLKDSHLSFLKHLVKELDVTPLAYVSTTHAVSHMLQNQTGVPTNAILVDIADPLVVTVVKGGKVVGSKTVKRSEDLPRDIERALRAFHDLEVLPSKIVLFGSGKLDKYRDEISSFNWMGTLPFLHLPKAEILEEMSAIKAISYAGASEINPNVSLPSNMSVPQQPRRMVMPGKDLEPEEERPMRRTTNLEDAFVAGDIAEREMEDEEEMAYPTRSNLMNPQQRRGMVSPGREIALPAGVSRAIGLVKERLAGPLAFLEKKGLNIKLPNGRRVPGKALIPVLALVLLLLGYVFLVKATVTVFVDPKVLEKDAQVVADPSVTTVDNANKVIPGKIVETDVEGNAKGVATGTKEIGDPAKGTIIIYNKTSSVKSFPSGTVLVGPNNLQFTLDSDVDNIATPSAEDGTWGNANASITAKQIGPDSNLPSGTQLTISGYGSSDFSAKVNTALSGGTSKNVTVVTSDDQKKLLASLASDLRSQAQTKLQGQLSGDEKILPEALSENITNTSYSKRVGDQATDFSLDMTIHYTGTAYSDNDLKTMVASLVETNVPDGYQLNLSETTTQADVSQLQKDGKLVFLARFKANLFPKLDTNSIKSQIKGKSPTQAAAIIQGMNNVIGSDIEIKPNLPGPLKLLPFLSSNINVVVTTK